MGGNRGRGQLYLNGTLSNNNSFNALGNGGLFRIHALKKSKGVDLFIVSSPPNRWTKFHLLAGPALLLTQPGVWVLRNGALTVNPNMGGFGQEECECVLQPLSNVIYHVGFSLCVLLTQFFLVLKKKQYERCFI